MKTTSRHTLHTVALLAIVHLLVTAIIAVVAVVATSHDAADFPLLWAGLVITGPMLAISAAVGLLVAIVVGRKTGRLAPPAPTFTSMSDDRRDDTGISMTGQPMSDGYDRHNRSFGMHDD